MRRRLSVLPEERQPPVEQSYRPIDDEKLADLIAQRGQSYSWSEEKRASSLWPVPRTNSLFSCGKENICCRRGSHLRVTYSSLRLKDTVTYPPTRLSPRCLPVPSAAGHQHRVRSINKIHYTITERYDRFPSDNGEVLRAHQEDFCQALGYGHERKYQEDGGPSFAQCFGMLRDVSSDPATDLQHLLRWQIFNVLAGNSDGHAKNLSLLYTPDGEIRLAPFYDLVCTRAIDRIDHHLALSVGKKEILASFSSNIGKIRLGNATSDRDTCLVLLRKLQPSCLRISFQQELFLRSGSANIRHCNA